MEGQYHKPLPSCVPFLLSLLRNWFNVRSCFPQSICSCVQVGSHQKHPQSELAIVHDLPRAVEQWGHAAFSGDRSMGLESKVRNGMAPEAGEGRRKGKEGLIRCSTCLF